MTVRELVDALGAFDPNLEVRVRVVDQRVEHQDALLGVVATPSSHAVDRGAPIALIVLE